jgi:hypothetical protein
MPVDERARHQLYRRLEEVLGPEEAGTLMNHLPPAALDQLATKADLAVLSADVEAMRVATKADLAAMGNELRAELERLGRRLVMWTSSMVLATGALAFAAGRFA